MIDRRGFLTVSAGMLAVLSQRGLWQGGTETGSGIAVQGHSVRCSRLDCSQGTMALGSSEPLPAHRVVILRAAGDGAEVGNPHRWVRPKHRGLVDEILHWTAPIRLSRQSTDKIGLIVRIMDLLVAHYQVQDRLEPWAKTMAAQEALDESSAMDNVAMPHCFQHAGSVRTENPDADWWLFLLPDGYACWESSDNPNAGPLHLMLLKVFANPESCRLHFDTLVKSRLRFRMHRRGDEWVEISRGSEAIAAHVVGRLIAKSSQITWESTRERLSFFSPE